MFEMDLRELAAKQMRNTKKCEIKNMTVAELEELAVRLKESAEKIRYIRGGRGCTPEFWNFVIAQVKIAGELTLRRLEPETF